MEVVRHQYKFMQQIFLLLAVVKEDVKKEPSHSIRLQQLPLLKGASCDEVTTVSGVPARSSGHDAPQRLKAANSLPPYRSAESVAPPGKQNIQLFSQSGT